MRQALISPMEPVQTGYRVAEVCDQCFEVAQPLFWVTCSEDVVADLFWYDPIDQSLLPVPAQLPAQQATVTGAQTL